MSSIRIQELIHALEEGRGSRWLKFLLLFVAVVALIVTYDARSYCGFSSVEAMDAAQVGRNLADGNGYTTDFIRPFSLYLVKQHNEEAHASRLSLTNTPDLSEIQGHHPDLANAPAYPMLLAGLFKVMKPDWKTESTKPFWSQGGHFMRYKPEFFIAIMNQVFLLGVIIMTFLIAKKMLDAQVAWLSAFLMLGLDLFWKFSVSGLSTMFLLLIFMGVIWCVVSIEAAARETIPPVRRLFTLAIAIGLLTGLGMLTRYSFGWLILPIVVFLILFGGTRRPGLIGVTLVTFAIVVTPWIIRNEMVSGTLFGTAGYAIIENSFVFPGSNLMQSVNPDLSSADWLRPYMQKLFANSRLIIQDDLLRLGGGWVAILFFAGLLLGLRNTAARRLRYLTLLCLLTLIVAQALGKTFLSDISGGINSENLLVLLTPLVVIFGVVFFLTLLDQMKIPMPQVRIAVMILLFFISSSTLIGNLIAKSSPVAYPPYYPPDIQKFSNWLHPDELMMSDIPWAVAWYGDRQCTWTTVNSQSDFYAINDYIKPIHGLYLSLDTLNQRLFTECLRGGQTSWGNFVYRIIALNQIPKGFPLRHFPPDSLRSGLFLTDNPRWR